MKRNLSGLTLLGVLAIMGCKPDESQPMASDTGEWNGDDGGSDEGGDDGGIECTAQVMETDPFDGQTGVFYRQELSVLFDEDASNQAQLSVWTTDGGEIPSAVSWDDSGLRAAVIADGLHSESDYLLSIDLCGDVQEVSFQTDEFGEFDIASADLVGKTFSVDMGAATYVEPAGLGPLIGNYLNTPLLFGVTEASDTEFAMIAAQGEIDDVQGTFSQVMDFPTFEIPAISFADAPYFSALTDAVGIQYEDTTITIHNFWIQGAFSQDGGKIGGGEGGGLVDTRNLGDVFGFGSDENAVCDFVATAGLDCEACPNDDEVLCLTLTATFEDAMLVEGLTLEEISGD